MLNKVSTITLRQLSAYHRRSSTKLILQSLPCISQKRTFAKTLFERMNERVPEMQERVKQIMSQVKDHKLSDVTVAQAAGGMRGVKALICDTSELDPNHGIRFRGLTLPEVQQKLPTGTCRGFKKSEYPLPEAMLWLLMTGLLLYGLYYILAQTRSIFFK